MYFKHPLVPLEVEISTLKKRIMRLEKALRKVDELRHQAKEGKDITAALKKPCMVIYN